MKNILLAVVILMVLALGAGIFISTLANGHDFSRQLSQEARAAEAVGAVVLPQAKIRVSVADQPKECVVVTDAAVDGTRLTFYIVNRCSTAVGYREVRWKSVAPDGTVIHSDWTNFTQFEANERMEYTYDRFHADPRIAEVRFSVKGLLR